MRIQLLSDLHLETEVFDPRPVPGADLLVLAGDIDATWFGYERFRGWPVPVLVIAGNHEFDGRDVDRAWKAFGERIAACGLTLLECDAWRWTAPDGTRLRVFGSVRWCDFGLFGARGRPRAMRAAGYFVDLMQARRGDRPFDVAAMREEALACRRWLDGALAEAPAPGERTVVVTHFGPSVRSADPRFGAQPATASFCNADDDLLPLTDLWLHGHLHCRHDYRVWHADGRSTRVVSQARGLAFKGEASGYEATRLIELG